MYGMVTKALVDMIVKEHGESTWRAVRERAGVDQDTFVSMDLYPDELTYALVGAASEVLEVPAEDLLRLFGHHWTTFAMVEGYGGLIRASGGALPSFLHRLDDMHARLMLTFPDARPPSFRVESETDEELRISYHSERDGLAPFVLGLLEGLGPVFDTTVDVTMCQSRADGATHDEFVVRYWS